MARWLYDDLQVMLTAYLCGYDNWRFDGSVAYHGSAKAGGVRTLYQEGSMVPISNLWVTSEVDTIGRQVWPTRLTQAARTKHEERRAEHDLGRIRAGRCPPTVRPAFFAASAAARGPTAQRQFGQVVDRGEHGPWWSWRLCWIAGLATGADHVLVIQDDVLPCRDFLGGVQQAIQHRPEDILGFFTVRRIQAEALEVHKSWIKSKTTWVQALVIPSATLPDFLEWSAAHIDPDYYSCDRRLTCYQLKKATPAFVSAPSLVEHIGSARSLIGHGKLPKPRLASRFIGEDVSALTIDWDARLNDPLRDSTDRWLPIYEKHFIP
jgi:hypothetical protein